MVENDLLLKNYLKYLLINNKMKIVAKINSICDKAQPYYAYSLLVLIHIALGACFYVSIKSENSCFNTQAIILNIVLYFIGYVFMNVVFLIPIAVLLVFSFMISVVMSLSIPLFLFFSAFEYAGANNVNVLEYGFLRTLGVLLLVTPFGILNTHSLLYLNKKFV